MEPDKKESSLEIAEDMNFQLNEWRVERWGWVGMIIITMAALLGLFGQGPLSQMTAQNGPIQVEYGRFERLLAPVQLIIKFDQQVVQNGEARVRIDESLLDFYTIQRIIPEPDSEELASGHVTYIIKVPQGGDQFEVTFNMQGDKVGTAQGDIGVDNGPTVSISQFIYP